MKREKCCVKMTIQVFAMIVWLSIGLMPNVSEATHSKIKLSGIDFTAIFEPGGEEGDHSCPYTSCRYELESRLSEVDAIACGKQKQLGDPGCNFDENSFGHFHNIVLNTGLEGSEQSHTVNLHGNVTESTIKAAIQPFLPKGQSVVNILCEDGNLHPVIILHGGTFIVTGYACQGKKCNTGGDLYLRGYITTNDMHRDGTLVEEVCTTEVFQDDLIICNDPGNTNCPPEN